VIGGKKKYIEMFGSFMEPFIYQTKFDLLSLESTAEIYLGKDRF